MSHSLSLPTVERERLHRRAVTFDGFARADGLFDIEAHLTDVKDRDFELLTGVRPAGVPVHDMWIRATIDRNFVIHAIEALTGHAPYPGVCHSIAPMYRKLVGANLVDGFRKRLHDTLGGVQGCTHLTEMLSYLPTAAIQTFAGLRREDSGPGKPFQLDRCHALATTADNVRRHYPQWYRGGAPVATDSRVTEEERS